MRALDWLSLSPKGYWGGDQDPAEKAQDEGLYLTLHCRYQNNFCSKMGDYT